VRAAVLYAFGEPLAIEDVAVEAPQAGEVLVRMAASGVCRSDWHTVQGIHRHPLPVILGHEGSAIVEELGEGVDGLAPGDHVVLSWLPYCGTCRRCAAGRPSLCEGMSSFDAGLMSDGTSRYRVGDVTVHHNVPSSFAEMAVVPARTAIKVDPSIPLDQVALIGCAVTTGFGAVVNTARVRPGRSVVVIGCGGVGSSVVQSARIAGAFPIVAVDRVPSKLELARSLGAHETVLASAAGTEAAVREVLGGGAAYLFECLGHTGTVELATRLTEPGGTAVLIGMAKPDVATRFDALSVTMEERTITGSWYGSCVPPRDFPIIAELVRSGSLRVAEMIGRTIALDGVNDALGWFEAGEDRRTVIAFG
jgi:S-(hydroxymethyl)glutathione dehydrogenase / alcohol dehydrogenase